MGLLKDVRLQRICHFKNTELTRLVTFPKAISVCSLCFFIAVPSYVFPWGLPEGQERVQLRRGLELLPRQDIRLQNAY